MLCVYLIAGFIFCILTLTIMMCMFAISGREYEQQGN
jgi:hypothetical protein